MASHAGARGACPTLNVSRSMRPYTGREQGNDRERSDDASSGEGHDVHPDHPFDERPAAGGSTPIISIDAVA